MIERMLAFALRNRFAVIASAVLMSLVGMWVVANMLVDAIPDLSENQVIVFTDWPGHTPKEIEDQITFPLTVNMQGLVGVKDIRAVSMFGFSSVTVVFRDGTDTYFARARVAERLNVAAASLPVGVVPMIGPDATALGQVFQYTLESPTLSNIELRTLQDTTVRYALQSVPGVAEVAAVGGAVKQYQIQVNPYELQKHSLMLSDVMKGVMGSNANVSAKVVSVADREYLVQGVGLIRGVEDIENIVISSRPDGIPIVVRDVADVEIGGAFRRAILDKNGTEAVGGVVLIRSGENPLAVIDLVKAKIRDIEPTLPGNTKIVPAYDRTELIHAAIHTVNKALAEEVIIVTLIILLFLWHVRSTLIVVITLPVAVLFAAIMMRLFGIPSNIMSLGGIAIGIGMMSDAAIVIVENCYRHLLHRQARTTQELIDTVLLASKEVVRPIVFSILIIILAFVPVFALQGMEGKMFTPLAFTKTFSMLGALILAVVFVPVLATFFLRGKLRREEENPVVRMLADWYKPILVAALERRRVVVAVSALITVLVVGIGVLRIGSEFMPEFDEGSVFYMPMLSPGVSIERAGQILKESNVKLKMFPEVSMVVGKVGRAETATDPAPISMIETIVSLKPKSEWRPGMTKERLVREMDSALDFPDAVNGFTQPIRNRIDMLSSGVRTMVAVKIHGDDPAVLQAKALEIENILMRVPGAVDVYAERFMDASYLHIDPRRDALATSGYGLTQGELAETVEVGLGGVDVTTTIEGRGRFPVQVRYAKEFRKDAESISSLPLATPGGAVLPLSQVADIRTSQGPSMLWSENGILRSTVQFNVRGRDIGSVVADAKQRIGDSGFTLPDGYALSFDGQFKNKKEAEARLRMIVPLVLLIIFLLLVWTYKSWALAAIVSTSIPMSLVGGVFALLVTGMNFSVTTWIGFIALFGVAVQTAVVMVIYLEHAYHEAGTGGVMTEARLREAVMIGAEQRLRPKLMTAGVAGLGLLPMLYASGLGAEIQRPMAAVILGGLISSLILTLIIIPIFFYEYRLRQLGMMPSV